MIKPTPFPRDTTYEDVELFTRLIKEGWTLDIGANRLDLSPNYETKVLRIRAKDENGRIVND